MRKEVTITLPDRDKRLTFRIREMPVTRLDSWLMRAILLLAGTDASLPEGAGMAEVGRFFRTRGLKALENLDYERAKPLLDELLGCCARLSDTGVEQQCAPETVDGYIEDVATLFTLRLEALKLNLGFCGQDAGDAD